MSNPRTISNICQLCFVVSDLEKTMQSFVSLGVKPFKVYSMDTKDITGVTYRGKPAGYSLAVAWASLGSWTLELIQPKRGQSIYHEHLDKHGDGIHHLGIYLDDYEKGYKEFIERGYKQTQGGPIESVDRTGRFDYFETEVEFGTILELLDMPENLGEPDYVFPESEIKPE